MKPQQAMHSTWMSQITAPWLAAMAGGVVGCLMLGQAWAVGIYTCTDAQGKRHTSDRPIPECLDREQRLLNKDGSQRELLPPRMTAEERAVLDEQKKQRLAAEAAQKDAIRRDRNLMLRYPNGAAHQKAREAAIDDLRLAIDTSERRIQELQAERKGLMTEAEFYKGKPLPPKLRTRVEANEAAQQAQKDVIQAQQAEIVRIHALYDAELARLKRLWAGATPGSVPEAVEVAAPTNPAAPPPGSVSRPASSSATR